MNLKPSSAAKVLLFYGLAVSVLPLVLGIERVCEVWLNIPEIPTEILVVLDGVIKMMIVSTLLPTSWTLLHPFLYLFKREWRNASDALIYTLGSIVCVTAIAPVVFVLMMLLEMRL